MGTYECLLQKTGSGTPSMDHAAVAYQEDKDGTAQKYPIDAVIWKYPRVVLTGGAGTDVDTAYADDGSGTLLDPQPYLSSQAFSDVSLTTPVTVPAIWDSANHDDTEGGYYCEIEYDGDDVDILLNDDVAIVYVTSDVLYLDDGTNTISNAITTGEHQIGIAWETDTSEMDLCLDGTWYGSSDAYDGSFGTGDLSTEATIRELKGITGDLATSKADIDTLMWAGYALHASFTAANQTFTDAQVLDTSAEGVEKGSLTVVDTSTGTVAIASNELSLVGTNAFSTTGVVDSTAKTKEIGLGFIISAEHSVTDSYGILPRWGDASDVSNQSRVYQWGFLNTGYIGLAAFSPSNTNELSITGIATYAANTQYKMAVVCGGYNSSGEAYAAGNTKADFDYGAAFFLYDGTNWVLEFKSERDNTTPLYFGIPIYSDDTSRVDFAVVPDYNFSDLFSPVLLDLSTDTDSTALASHTPDVDTEAGGWTDSGGYFSILSNKVSPGAALATQKYASIDSGLADIYLEAETRTSRENDENSYAMVMFRYTDSSNFWEIGVTTFNPLGTWTWGLREKASGTTTTRASSAGSTSGDVTVTQKFIGITDDESIYVYLPNEGISLSYLLATSNKTATSVGFHAYQSNAGAVTPLFDSLVVLPRGTGGEYNDLENY